MSKVNYDILQYGEEVKIKGRESEYIAFASTSEDGVVKWSVFKKEDDESMTPLRGEFRAVDTIVRYIQGYEKPGNTKRY